MDEHIPVLVEEVLDVLAPSAGAFYVDATFGRGGHTARLLEVLGSEGSILALDRDPQAIAAGQRRFKNDKRVELVQAPITDLYRVVQDHACGRCVQGILFDLGVSSPQLDNGERGFSFGKDGPLDMRMDPTRGESAAQWLEHVGLRELHTVIAELGEERFARRIAQFIVSAREHHPIVRTLELATLVQRVVPTRELGKNSATRTFQAIRMFINDELGQLSAGLNAAYSLLVPGARLAVISFHSLEDRMVKQFIRAYSTVDPMLAGLPVIPPEAQPVMREIGRKRRASLIEIQRNPRARSAVLRCAERLAPFAGKLR